MRPVLAVASSAVAALLAAQCIAQTQATGPSRTDLARLHAPLYRFNAWVPGNSSPGNKSEDYFPMSVGGWLHQLRNGRARVVTKESNGKTPSVNQTRPLVRKIEIAKDAIHGVPARMAGDAPGDAPVYFHVHDEGKTIAKDGSGEERLVIQYWLFYGQDASRDRVSPVGFGPKLDLAGHVGDWEQTSLAVTVLRGQGGKFLRTEVRRAYYTAHGAPRSVERGDFQLEGGTHPVVYVAAGKHASYPEPGWWQDPNGYAPWIVHDEFFLGNGYAWRSWEKPLHVYDLDGAATLFVQNGFDWRSYAGTFGDDRDLTIPLLGKTFPTGQSPRAPKLQSSYGDLSKTAKPWRDEKRTAKGLHLGASPVVSPVPLPKRLP
ncbi:MAG: Vps62-related protein [Planctomycetota bacterium]